MGFHIHLHQYIMKTTMSFGQVHADLGIVEVVCMNDVEQSIRVRACFLPLNSRSQGGGPRGSAGRSGTAGSGAGGSCEDVAWVDGIGLPEDLRLLPLQMVFSGISENSLFGFEVEGVKKVFTSGGTTTPVIDNLLELLENLPDIGKVEEAVFTGGGGGTIPVVDKLLELLRGRRNQSPGHTSNM